MREALELLLRLNLAAAGAVLAVMLLRVPVRRLFGPRIAYGLWMLVPLTVAAMLVPARVITLQRPSPDTAAITQWSQNAMGDAASPAMPAAHVHIAPPPQLAPWLIGLWLAGAAVALAALVRNQARFERAARSGRAGPAVVGVLKPRIVTPEGFEGAYTAQERRLVLAHEATHIARQDSRINALVAVTRCLAWFNPLVWVMGRSLRIDQEFACDATVMARHPRSRRAYGEALLKAQLAARPLPLGCHWEATHPLVARIALLARPRGDTLSRALGAATLALVAVGGATAVWAERPPRWAYTPSHEAIILAQAVRFAPPLKAAATRVSAQPEAKPVDPPRQPEPRSVAYYGQAPNGGTELALASAQSADVRLIQTAAQPGNAWLVRGDMIPRSERIRGVADLSSVEPGTAARVLATMADNQGNQLTTDLTAFGSQSLYRVGYVERNGSRLKLFTSVVQHGDRFLVTAALNGSFRSEISGSVELAAGAVGHIRLASGQMVEVQVFPRPETPEEIAAAHALRGRHFVNVEQYPRTF